MAKIERGRGFGSNLALRGRLRHKNEVKFETSLPIDDVLPALTAALDAAPRAVLVAPPGAGKTTRVPLALLDAHWQSGKILMLEPRRLAARAAAMRMVESLGERLGQTIGLRVRMETLVSAATRIEIVTEGVFTRMILDDPALDGVSAVIFDEFHERSLDADLGLALALDAQAGLREELRILVMSATLDGARVASLLGDAPVLHSEGRAFPVTTLYKGYDPQMRLEEQVGRVVLAAVQEQEGSVLVFMPGQGEITRLAAFLNERIRDPAMDVVPLYGALDRAAQTRAIAPPPVGHRKIVIATSIAETSITIDGVRVVVDSGFARVPRYEPDLGLTRLETRRLSRASADQRRGRAGRTQPGVCYRLWEEAGNGALEPFTQPEILSADLSGLLLDLAAWGASPDQLSWLDSPPKPALKEAGTLLQEILALDEAGRLTDTGRKIRALPLPPRLAAMVIRAGEQGEAVLAADIALLISERGLGGESVDLVQRLERFYRDKGPRVDEARRMAKTWARQAGGAQSRGDIQDAGRLLALAFPDRIARARGKPGEFLMVNGRAAFIDPADPLARVPFLAVGEIIGRASASRIVLAAPISLEDILRQFPPEMSDEISFDMAAKALRARRVSRLGALVFKDQPLPIQPNAETALKLAEGIGRLGLEVLPWSKATLQLCHRVEFLRRAEAEGSEWPDLSMHNLQSTVAHWLGPQLEHKTSLSQISAEDVFEAVSALLPWDMHKRLEREAPTHFTAPTGSHVALDYETEGGPVLAIRVQELFGLSEHPRIARGKLPLTLHLLSPAHRPIQITKDLPGFWQGSWAAVKSEMKGRYPRHVWPDDPAKALPTARAKPRGT